jgi:hypothetical protein
VELGRMKASGWEESSVSDNWRPWHIRSGEVMVLGWIGASLWVVEAALWETHEPMVNRMGRREETGTREGEGTVNPSDKRWDDGWGGAWLELSRRAGGWWIRRWSEG